MRTCDMFCRVIDNYGDAGVSWRLARMLAREAGWAVRLIIDDAAVLSAIVPSVRETDAAPAAGEVAVTRWLENDDKPFALWDGTAADVVVELFSCRLPTRTKKRSRGALKTPPAPSLPSTTSRPNPMPKKATVCRARIRASVTPRPSFSRDFRRKQAASTAKRGLKRR